MIKDISDFCASGPDNAKEILNRITQPIILDAPATVQNASAQKTRKLPKIRSVKEMCDSDFPAAPLAVESHHETAIAFPVE